MSSAISNTATKWTPSKGFWITLAIVALWVNASEVFRYFVFVMPMIRDALPEVRNVAPITPLVFASWMVWDTILIAAVFGFVWLFVDRFGSGWKNAVIAGTLVWAAIFVILWLGMLNLNLANFSILAIALSLSWIELVVAALIVDWGSQRFEF